MNYQLIYDNLIKRSVARTKPECYTEDHHIIPRCLNGIDHVSNLTALTAREHYLAHAMLAKLYGGGLWRAFYMMSNLSGRVNSKLYVRVRARAITIQNALGRKHSDEAIARMSNAQKGKVISEEQRRKISETKKKAGISSEHRLKLIGWKQSEESRKKISEGNKGRVVGDHAREIASATHKGKIISEETRKRISESNKGKLVSKETRARISAAHLNRLKGALGERND